MYWFNFLLSSFYIHGFNPNGIYPCMLLSREMVISVYFHYWLFFGPKMKEIGKVAQELKYYKLSLTIEDSVYLYLSNRSPYPHSTLNIGGWFSLPRVEAIWLLGFVNIVTILYYIISSASVLGHRSPCHPSCPYFLPLLPLVFLLVPSPHIPSTAYPPMPLAVPLPPSRAPELSV